MAKNIEKPAITFCGQTSRREFLHQVGGGFTSLALTGMMAKDGFLSNQAVAADGKTPWATPLAAKNPPLPAKAKHVIFLFMYGGPSQVDTFDYKPELIKRDGQPLPGGNDLITFQGKQGNLTRSPWEFKPRGQSGKMISELVPNLGELADEMCFIHSLTG